MKIVMFGAGGDIGKVACAELSKRHEIITVGRSSGAFNVDMTDKRALAAMFAEIGEFDALVSTAGDCHFGPLADFTYAQFMQGLKGKVMGQINAVLEGLKYISDGGSITLTSGVLDRDPIRNGVGAATANGAIGGFVVGSAIEMPRGIRINVVSPGMLEVSAKRYGEWFPGHVPVPSDRVGLAYVKSVEGFGTGQVIIVA